MNKVDKKDKAVAPQPYIIAVDFDGCLCDSYWPELGEPIPEVLA